MTPVRFGRTSPKQVYVPRNSTTHIKTLPLPNEIRKQTPWPSGLRRRIKVPVRKGVSSNLTGVSDSFFLLLRHAFDAS